jgi:aconitate hydratase
VRARRENAPEVTFEVQVRIDTAQELLYYRHGGILTYVLRQLMHRERPEVAPGGLAAAHVRHDEAVPLEVEQGSAESFPASDAPSY